MMRERNDGPARAISLKKTTVASAGVRALVSVTGDATLAVS